MICIRHHVLEELEPLLQYHGRLRVDLSIEEEAMDLPGPDHFEGAFTVSVNTQRLLELVILSRMPLGIVIFLYLVFSFIIDRRNSDKAYTIRTILPGYLQNGQDLATYDPETEPTVTWVDGVDNAHMLPAIGPADALRVLLIVDPIEIPVSSLSSVVYLSPLFIFGAFRNFHQPCRCARSS